MNGPQHYREAERLISTARPDSPDARDPVILATAQVHATLALAAATVLSGVIRNTVAASHPVNELAHDDETVDAVNAWHETAAR
ncbi:hypothetical protein KNU54_gp55 [Gordonia phage VanDeWege]|uniref:Uncharacterized protein n=5 Tax=Wizardvirus TaxID=2169658 RepID=A0A161HSW2_9CAUD|nr:hypothetical protein BH794_gp51 [Gordonia phage Wizard]YP_010102112.1 hypothetical protein KNU54_gp55 [Gordonia phage VanDeWege]YP_010102399.1 hypothetical protein KNU57_gp54 [Gordonia phage Valary]YP_010103065.1 hypothetical protein KNU63_gp55 [Gordonia phage RogerDodger]WNO27921.1 hypothetical protein SEA_HALO3_53 [Gordonia phage Halo3]ANA85356.1 hypothetical protein WIZARD_51 [Gordonia phage Wizard]QDB74637.1 hypothetical protein SEA_VANDEWEGE_55 [Gordonia phage VanDeWege]QDB74923.1 hy